MWINFYNLIKVVWFFRVFGYVEMCIVFMLLVIIRFSSNFVMFLISIDIVFLVCIKEIIEVFFISEVSVLRSFIICIVIESI